MGPMVDLSTDNISLSLIGSHVSATGAASGLMRGEIHALFYRYKSQGGFEYVADLFIGPRTPKPTDPKKVQAAKAAAASKFSTHPGDSGSLWLLESRSVGNKASHPPLPLAMQWGENTLYSGQPAIPQSYALATFLSRVCALMELDPIRDWNLDQPDTWGAMGHFSIASRTLNALSGKLPKLKSLMTNNLQLITHDDQTLLTSDFEGMADAVFVPLADVPDFYWKHGKQGHSRQWEGPNHFADMDQPRPSDGETLLSLCKSNSANINPTFWNAFYNSVKDVATGDDITDEHRGLLPFRVWQIFDAMVGFASDAKTHDKFVCAAGVLTHYLGDACQPLHISYMFDGDPARSIDHTVNHKTGKKAGTSEVVKQSLGMGMHSMYEDTMVNAMRSQILNGLLATPKVAPKDYVTTGFDAAKLTVGLMSDTFKAIAPKDILDAFLNPPAGVSKAANMHTLFGKKTVDVMMDGTHLTALLWESAWALGGGEAASKSVAALTQQRAMAICADDTFVPSCTIGQVGQYLSQAPAGPPPAKKVPAKKAPSKKVPGKKAAAKTPAERVKSHAATHSRSVRSTGGGSEVNIS